MAYIEKEELYPDLRLIDGPAEPEVMVDGKKVLMFSSNNYLGLATHPKVIEAGIEAIMRINQKMLLFQSFLNLQIQQYRLF